MTAVELQGVSKRFGSTVAVADVSLRVDDGELLSLVGPSGCGKSTLLQLIAGLLAPDAGTLRIGGRAVAGDGPFVPPEERGVGLVFQDAALFPHLRVADNVAFGLPRGGDRSRRVEELLGLVDLGGLAQRYPHELSGGQQQRVALARALAPRPRAVLFDEAFANLDSNLRVRVREQTVEVLRASGAAGVFVTHDQAEALALGDRVAVLSAGRLQQVAEPAEAFHRPANRFVATFLGEADFLPGTSDGAGVRTELGLVPAVLPGASTGAVEAMVRPHEVQLAADEDGNGQVVRREFRGASYLYTVRLRSGATVRSLQPHVVDLPQDARVTVTVDASHPAQAFSAGAP